MSIRSLTLLCSYELQAFSTGILIQRRDSILEWTFLSHKLSKKNKTYVGKVSDLILKGTLKLHQLAGIDPAEIVVPFPKGKKNEKL